MEDWALIRRLAAEGVPKARIAERLGISRTTVVKAVGSEAPPRYERWAATLEPLAADEPGVTVSLDEHRSVDDIEGLLVEWVAPHATGLATSV